MSIPVKCPACRAVFHAPDRWADRRVECENCGKLVRVPAQGDTPRARRISSSQRVAGCGGCLVVVMLLACGGLFGLGWHSNKLSKEVERADQMFAAGQQAEAVAIYKEHFDYAKDKPGVLKRVVEYEAKQGNVDEARRWAARGLDERLDVPYETAAAKNALADARVKREADSNRKKEEEARKAAEAEAKRAAVQQQLKDEAEKRKLFGTSGDAREAARKYVMARVNFPAEASFYWLPVHEPPEKLNPDGSWTVWGGIKTKNGFGVREKFVWKVTVRKTESGWEEMDASVVEDR